jgi:hypothetical protein
MDHDNFESRFYIPKEDLRPMGTLLASLHFLHKFWKNIKSQIFYQHSDQSRGLKLYLETK